MQFIDLKTQYQAYREEINASIQRVLDHGGYINGPEVKQLEEELAAYCGANHCIAVSNGTDALMIAMMALGIGPGDEVITVPYSFIASATMISMVGATPVFVDIEHDTFNIDASKIEAAITEKTRAIIPVCLFGQMPDMEVINAIADRHGIPVIEDAAQSFGGSRNGVMSGSASAIATTSFFPAKPLGAYGDGGAIFVREEELALRVRQVMSHGGLVRYHHDILGTNGRCDTLQAAILQVKLKHFKAEMDARQEVAQRYHKLFEGVCETPVVKPGNISAWAQYTLRTPKRDEVCAQLNEAGIPTAIYYPLCLHEQPVFKSLGYQPEDFPVAKQASKEVFSVPMHPWLRAEQQEEIAAIVRQCCLAHV